jgi:intermediate peptidase
VADRSVPVRQAKVEQKLLLDAKRKHEGRSGDHVYMWDLPYYMGMLKAQTHRIDSRVISAYFPLENCLKGLHLLCSALFGLELKQVPMLNASEGWHEDVVKLALTRNGERLGYMYFDLYPRPHKYNHAAHFTIRCGKRLSETSYQKPIVALVCNFNKPAPDSPSLLTHAEVETLFHEFGHAMHSLLSRTEFQHLSGTRAALDFVETPSHLFEYFAWDYRVVSEFAHHYRTGAPLPPAMMQGLRASKTMFAAMDTQTQCLYSNLDLKLFGEQPLPCTPPTSTQMLHELQNSSTLVPHVDGTYWHTRFGHLIGYGAGYYSYLYARVFAADIWHTNFVGPKGPLNRVAGEKLYQQLMVHGGAKDPNELLVDMLGREPSPTSYLHELGV